MAYYMVPDSGIRQLNLKYEVNDPEFAAVEQLRSRTNYRQLNRMMLEALRIGAAQLLAQAGEAQSQSQSVIPHASVPQAAVLLVQEPRVDSVKRVVVAPPLTVQTHPAVVPTEPASVLMAPAVQPVVRTNTDAELVSAVAMQVAAPVDASALVDGPSQADLSVKVESTAQNLGAGNAVESDVASPEVTFSAAAKRHLNSW